MSIATLILAGCVLQEQPSLEVSICPSFIFLI